MDKHYSTKQKERIKFLESRVRMLENIAIDLSDNKPIGGECAVFLFSLKIERKMAKDLENIIWSGHTSFTQPQQ